MERLGDFQRLARQLARRGTDSNYPLYNFRVRDTGISEIRSFCYADTSNNIREEDTVKGISAPDYKINQLVWLDRRDIQAKCPSTLRRNRVRYIRSSNRREMN